MVGYQGRDPQETFLRSLMWNRPQITRSQLEPDLRKLFDGTYQLMMGRDLSQEPSLFGRALRVRGLFVYKQAHLEFGEFLSQIEFDVILYNEIELAKVSVPPGFVKIRLRDLQEFPYTAAIQVHKPE
jgi:hypothetical protein